MLNRGTLLTPSSRRAAVRREGARGCDYESRRRSGPGHCLAPLGSPRGDQEGSILLPAGFKDAIRKEI